MPRSRRDNKPTIPIPYESLRQWYEAQERERLAREQAEQRAASL